MDKLGLTPREVGKTEPSLTVAAVFRCATKVRALGPFYLPSVWADGFGGGGLRSPSRRSGGLRPITGLLFGTPERHQPVPRRTPADGLVLVPDSTGRNRWLRCQPGRSPLATRIVSPPEGGQDAADCTPFDRVPPTQVRDCLFRVSRAGVCIHEPKLVSTLPTSEVCPTSLVLATPVSRGCDSRGVTGYFRVS